MESLDRPYGDDETDYVTVNPEATPDRDEDAVPGPPPANDFDDRVRDPAFQAVEEAGGGVSEGFEIAEGQLMDNIAGAPPADRTLDGFDPDAPDQDVDEDVADDVAKTFEDHDPGDAIAQPREEEARLATAVYGEPDELDVTEVVRDPEEERAHGDDPGQGPGVAFDR
jgi:hypothetical protein